MKTKTALSHLLTLVTIPIAAAQFDLKDAEPERVNEDGKYTPEPTPQSLHTSQLQLEKKMLHLLNISKQKNDNLTYANIKINIKDKSITFPIRLNINQGIVEYILVNEQGKVHEALFTTKIKPSDIQLCLLLLSAKPEQRIEIELNQSNGAPRNTTQLTDYISFTKKALHTDKQTPIPTGWKFSGSLIDQYGFVADREGSIISLIPDITAVCSHQTLSVQNEEEYHVIPNKKINQDKPLFITIKL